VTERMPDERPLPPLSRLAARAAADPAFLGWQLAAFARARGFDDTALAVYLECECAALDRARLCRPIRADHFRADVVEVATKFGLNATRLAEATKELPTERRAEEAEPDPAPGVAFLAARDRADQS
jgi:hypothetical protein